MDEPRRRGRPPGSRNKKQVTSKPVVTLGSPSKRLAPVSVGNEITENDASSAPVETTAALERALVRNLAAGIIGVSPSLVNQWVQNGGIKTNPNGDIPLSEIRRKTVEWFKKNVGKRSGDDGEDAIDAKLRAERAKASLAELDLEERLAGLVSRKAASMRMVDVFTMVKTRVLGMPERLSAELASKTDPRDVKEFLAKYVHEMLTDLSGDDVTTAAD